MQAYILKSSLLFLVMDVLGVELNRNTILGLFVVISLVVAVVWLHSYAISIEVPRSSFPCNICH